MTDDERLKEAIKVSEAVAFTAITNTKFSGIGILGTVIASVAMARSENMSREQIEQAYKAAINDAYGVNGEIRPIPGTPTLQV